MRRVSVQDTREGRFLSASRFESLKSDEINESHCAVFVAGTFPIDLAKTRLQVQGQVGDSKHREIRYRGMLHAMLRIGREEGLRALYSGSVCTTRCTCLQTLLHFIANDSLHFLLNGECCLFAASPPPCSGRPPTGP